MTGTNKLIRKEKELGEKDYHKVSVQVTKCEYGDEHCRMIRAGLPPKLSLFVRMERTARILSRNFGSQNKAII